MPPIALTIAGSDPSGGAGVQADLKTFHQYGCYGCAVITLLTVQNTQTVKRVEVMPADLVSDQLDTLLEDIRPDAAKTGALGTEENVRVVAECIARKPFPLVVDPVMVSKHGSELNSEPACTAMVRYLFPYTAIVTPNLPEAQQLSKRTIRGRSDVLDAAKIIADMGARAVLVKGGHGPDPSIIVDTLYIGGEVHEFQTPRILSPHTHGVGCSLSAAIVTRIGVGIGIVDAVADAKEWLTRAIRSSPGIGKGIGTVNHLEQPAVRR